ncbi:MAG TPA: hypothetical protein VKY82_05660, partial [Flavobacterium sp.]|nr:hypothetical protein [Flavobacterium sp.]
MIQKAILTLSLFILAFSLSAQKAKDEALKTNYHYLTYPEKAGVSTKFYAMSISEEYACDGAVPAKTYTTPITADPRGTFYLNMVPGEKSFFIQAKDLYGNMISKKENFTEITIHTSDIRLTNQRVDEKSKTNTATEKGFFLSFDVSVPAEIKIRRRGDIDEVLMDVKSDGTMTKKMTFPTDVKFSSKVTDVERNGFNSKDDLMKAWNKYKKHSTMEWRDKLLTEFFKPVYMEYKKRFMLYEIWDQAKVNSDKNKKGGYDHIASAATNFIAVFDAIEKDYNANKFNKQWTKEYQEQLNTSLKVWEAFLAETNFDVSVNENLVSSAYRQKILLNYIQGLIYTGQFDKAEEVIDTQLKADIKSGTGTDLKRLK